ncbi:hypothetical protein SK128_015901 [Halocaridina rubra]|uniref:Uncharacterized protein n=1 Tax=Halocaridina rubra TaxID=373956 RepID=A0AAN8WUH5_HALRR
MICAATVRDATGNVTQIADWSFTNCTGIDCKYGIQNSAQVMELMSIFGPLIYAGCFAASLSSALTTLVSSFKIFQALCRDKLYPGIYFFAKGYGKTDEPYRSYVLSVAVVIIFNLIARLDSIAPIITNFFMATYALINFSCVHASLQKSPAWRPAFKYYNPWLSLIGGVMCTVIMFFTSWWTALITFIIIILLCFYVKIRKPDANWGSSTQSQLYTTALDSAATLSITEEHIKTYRPQILVMTGAPNARPPLVHFANAITKKMSLLVIGHCIQELQTKRNRDYITKESIRWLAKHKIRGFYALADGFPMGQASRTLMANVGLGKLRPNLVLLGHKSDWQTCLPEERDEYFKVIQHAFDMHLAVGVLRVEGGLDYSHVIESLHQEEESKGAALNGSSGSLSTVTSDSVQAVSYQNLRTNLNVEEQNTTNGIGGLVSKKKPPQEYKYTSGESVPTCVIDNMLRFTTKQPKGTIDVWWLFDDGGLTVLIPYILTTRSQWSQCSMRVFFLANKKTDMASEQRRMAELLGKFRIEFSDVIMIPDVQKPAKKETMSDFNELIGKFVGDSDEEKGQVISEAELLALKDKTNRHLRIRELLLEHSGQASMIVMTLPVPTVGTVSAPLYLAWLETLTKDLPPFLLVRGSQSSVLTFYS